MTTVSYLCQDGGTGISTRVYPLLKPVAFSNVHTGKVFNFVEHPSPPYTQLSKGEDGQTNISSPYSSNLLNDCYQEQIQGVVSIQSLDLPDDVETIIPLVKGNNRKLEDVPCSNTSWWSYPTCTVHIYVEDVVYTSNHDIEYARIRVDALYWFGWMNSSTKEYKPWKSDWQRYTIPPLGFGPIPMLPPSWRVAPSNKVMVESFLNRYGEYAQGDPMHWGNLCQRATDSIRSIDVNGIAYLKDSIEIIKSVYHFLSKGPIVATGEIVDNLGRRIVSVRDAARSAASTYLSNHYGTKLMIQDTKEIDHALRELRSNAKRLYQRANASYSVELDHIPGIHNSGPISWTRRVSATVRSFSNDLLDTTESIKESIDQFKALVMRTGYEYDLLPTASNLWDLIPFSFVVDWFLPIGKQLEHMESIGYMSSLPVQCVCYTDILEFDQEHSVTDDTHWGGSGILHHKIYIRRCSDRFVLPKPLDESVRFGLKQHWLEAAALITNLFA